jgi:hypothetical protein
MAGLFETLASAMGSAYKISMGLHHYVQNIDLFLQDASSTMMD